MLAKSNIEAFYNNEYTKYAQIVLPLLVRSALNIYDSKSVFRGIITLAAFSAVKQTPPHYQLISCLFYSPLVNIGLKKDVAMISTKMLTTALYGCKLPTKRVSDGFEKYKYESVFRDYIIAVIPDISDFLITYYGIPGLVGDHYMLHYLLYVAARSVGLICSGHILNEGRYECFAQGNYLAFYTDLFEYIMPVEGISPLKDYMPETMYNFLHSYVDAAVGSNLQSV